MSCLSLPPNQCDLLSHNNVFHCSQHQDSYNKTPLNHTQKGVLYYSRRSGMGVLIVVVYAVKLAHLKADISVIKLLHNMFAESHSWQRGSAYWCQEKTSNNEAAEICQETVNNYQEYWEPTSWPRIWFMKLPAPCTVSLGPRRLRSLYHPPTDDRTSTGKALWPGHNRGNKIRSPLSRPEQPGTDSLIGKTAL